MKKYKRFQPRFAVDIYRWSMEGASDKAIAMNLGVSWGAISQWKRRYKSVRYAFWRAEKDKLSRSKMDWGEYVKGRLPYRLHRIWKEMCALEDGPTGYAKARALLRTKNQRVRQQLLIYAVLANGFNLTKALRITNIPRKTLADWMENDPEFTDLLHEVQEAKKDFFEEGLVRLVRAGDSPATVFANRTQNRDRGYGEKTEVVHSGQIMQWTIPVSELNLPPQVLRTLLNALKERQLAKPVEAQVLPSSEQDRNKLLPSSTGNNGEK